MQRFVQDEHLRQALSFHSLLVGGNPFETSAIYTLIHYLERNWGVFFPRGGTGRAGAGAGEALRRSSAASCACRRPVRRIEVDRRPRARAPRHAPDAGTEPFDLVVSNADLHHTYAQLLRRRPARRGAPTRRLERMDWSMSLFVLYFGTDPPLPDLAHHTVVFGPRYEGLLDDIFHGRALPDDFSLYLHAPTRDRPVARAARAARRFYVLSPVPHLGHAPLDWETAGPRTPTASSRSSRAPRFPVCAPTS